MQRIIITGCAKTGTTLLQRLFTSYADIIVLPKEHKLSTLLQYKSNIVIKRKSPTILSEDFSPAKKMYQKNFVQKNNIKIINMIRDGRDVICSDGNIVHPDRWVSCMLQREMFRSIITLEIKYEDLVTNPNDIQDKITKTFNFKPIYRFNDYPNFVPLEFRGLKPTIYRLRSIGTKSIGKGIKRYKTRNPSPLFEKLIEEYIKGESVYATF